MSYPRIVFHHIPKCGGTSFARGLAATYYPLRLFVKRRAGFPGGLDVRAADLARRLLHMDAHEVRRVLLAYRLERDDSPLVYGHYPFSQAIHEQFKGKWSFITILRHPEKRWYSEYNYNRWMDAGPGRTDLDMEAYLESDQGRAAARSFVNYLGEPTSRTAVAGEEDAKRTINALEKFDVVGCLEDLDHFRDAMKRRFGRRPYVPHLNKGVQKKSIQRELPSQSDSFQRKLAELLQADLYIYETVLKQMS